MRVIKAFVRADHENRRFDRANGALLAVSIRVFRLLAILNPTLMLVLNLGTVAVVWSAAMRSKVASSRPGRSWPLSTTSSPPCSRWP